MKKEHQQRQNLLELAITEVSRGGMRELSLRRLASVAGTSTTVIFQHFNGKGDLIRSALEVAILREKSFHDDLLTQASIYVKGFAGFADFLANYIVLRPSMDAARFTSELLINLDDYPECHGLISGWHEDRRDFWNRVLLGTPSNPEFSDIVAQYVVMEEYYAFALQGDFAFGMLLAETARAISDCAFHGGVARSEQSCTSAGLNVQPMSVGETGEAGHASIKEQLLAEAKRVIDQHGLDALNQRRITRSVGVSGSAISYYFGDMKTFRNRAIWRALINNVPSQLDPHSPLPDAPATMAQWLRALDEMLQPATPESPSGFYIGFARLTAQACLLSRQDPSLGPLISHLRALEGWGTYRVSRSVPALSPLIRREHAAAYGAWIKAEALLRCMKLALPGPGTDHLKSAAKQIFPQRLT
jgi:AcrR family transcriptional regulator